MSSLSVEPGTSLLDRPHHDGSDLYVVEQPVKLGDHAVVRIRVPQPVESVLVRYVENGEPRSAVAKDDGEG